MVAGVLGLNLSVNSLPIKHVFPTPELPTKIICSKDGTCYHGCVGGVRANEVQQLITTGSSLFGVRSMRRLCWKCRNMLLVMLQHKIRKLALTRWFSAPEPAPNSCDMTLAVSAGRAEPRFCCSG